jgi:hypothetical protein
LTGREFVDEMGPGLLVAFRVEQGGSTHTL